MPRAIHQKIDNTLFAKRKINLEQSFLLKLPAELRKEIYNHALTADGPLEITHDNVSTQTALLKVCHQIRLEARPNFYGANTFLITNIQETYTSRFLDLARRSMVRRIPLLKIRLSVPEHWWAQVRRYFEIYRLPAGDMRDKALSEARGTTSTHMDEVKDLVYLLRSYGIRVDRMAVRKLKDADSDVESVIQEAMDQSVVYYATSFPRRT